MSHLPREATRRSNCSSSRGSSISSSRVECSPAARDCRLTWPAVPRASLRWRRVFALAAYLYVRAGELRALRGTDLLWLDEDRTRCVVHVHRAAKRDTGGREEKGTKTGLSRRFEAEPTIVPLLRVLWDELQDKSQRLTSVPHEADLSARLVQYLRWTGVDREDLYARDHARCPITFKDFRATGTRDGT